MIPMTIGSLFSGIGGLELGLERAGLGPVLWQVETDPFCRRVLARHWPHAERFENVEDVGAHNLARVDLICGGFPCTDISLAGKGRGLAGPRSGLFFELARIVGDLRPRFVVLENVSAILVRGMGDVLGTLSALGYDAWWDCIPAAGVGAPHRRDRIFVVAWRVPDAERNGVRHEPERGEGAAQATDRGHAVALDVGAPLADADGTQRQGSRRSSPKVRSRESSVLANADGGRLETQRLPSVTGERRERGERGDEFDGRDVPHWPPAPDDVHAWGRLPAEAQPAICRVAHGVPRGVDRRRLKALGNAVVPAVAEIIGHAVVEAFLKKDGAHSPGG